MLLLYSRSRPAELARRERHAEEALAVLPMAKLMAVVDRIMNLLRETETLEEVTSNQAQRRNLDGIVCYGRVPFLFLLFAFFHSSSF